MKLAHVLKERASTCKSNLITLGTQPISKAAVAVVIFLDVFILASIFDGLDSHTRQLTAPDEYIPYSCQQMIIKGEWNSTVRYERLSELVLDNSLFPASESARRELHPLCRPYLSLVDSIRTHKETVSFLDSRRKLLDEASTLETEVNNLKGGYDTALLETIAKSGNHGVGTESIKGDVHAKTGALNNLRGEVKRLEDEIDGDPDVKRLWQALDSVSPANKEKLTSDLRRSGFWYPVKRLGMKLVFLLPLFGIFWAWNGYSIRAGRGAQMLVSSHMVVVASIPILFTIIGAVNDVVPKALLTKLIALLESLDLIALWSYFFILVAIGVSLFLVYILQKKLFTRERLLERRIEQGLCQNCGKRLPQDSAACPFCGFSQFKQCVACNGRTLTYGRFCRCCGVEQ